MRLYLQFAVEILPKLKQAVIEKDHMRSYNKYGKYKQ